MIHTTLRAARAARAALVSLAFVACTSTSTPTTGSCQVAGANPACIDYLDASDLTSQRQLCDDSTGSSWSEQTCTKAGALGGCSATIDGASGSFTQITWYYAGQQYAVAGDVMAACAAHGETFVAP